MRNFIEVLQYPDGEIILINVNDITYILNDVDEMGNMIVFIQLATVDGAIQVKDSYESVKNKMRNALSDFNTFNN